MHVVGFERVSSGAWLGMSHRRRSSEECRPQRHEHYFLSLDWTTAYVRYWYYNVHANQA